MTATKLDRIRKAMLRLHIDVLIVPSTDPHQSEYLPSFWKCREWLTGFTGSAGVVVVTQSQALFWTDSRYFIQAEIELNPPFQLVKQVTRNPEFIDWINTNLDFGKNVGIDGQLVSHVMFEQMLKTFATKQIKVSLTGDLFQQFWESRPLLPDGKIFEHEGALAGESRKQKIEKLITLLNLNKAGYLVISTLDDIAWLLNLRGNDIPFNPVFLSYCVQTPDTTHLFVDFKKIDEAIQEKLNNDGVLIHSYEDIHKFLNKIKPYTNVLVDEANLNQALYSSIPHECKIIDNGSIIAKYKAVKNEVQIKEYRLAQKFDGIAMCNFLHWIENKVSQKPITEVDAAGMMEKFRAAQPGYRGLSFPVISAYGPNAALPHYSPGKRSNAVIEPKGVYLVDCGSQYLNGTTDITRTIALGPVDQQVIDAFTIVLKAHIALASAVFPVGTKGFQLDSIARAELWKNGMDYGHGTGHGIGYFLSVHEGPHGLSVQGNGPGSKIIEPGMLVTNEPGFYLEGKFGIRIENVVLCVPAFKENNTDFLQFETVSLCPIDKNLINVSLLNDQEIEWINRYHQKIFETLSQSVCQEVKSWLGNKTLPLNRT